MKIAVFGSTGSVGQQVVAQALEQGHDVTAHTRRPEKFQKPHPNLTVVQGDVLESDSVKAAAAGQDGVICTLGMPLRNKDGLRARGTKNIVSAMEEVGVKRLVCLSGLGVGDSLQTLPFFYRYFIIPVILRHVYADHEVQEGYVKNSGLDWILARPANFVEGDRTGSYRHGFKEMDSSYKLKISHGDVADFLLRQMADNRYLHQTTSLSY